MPNASDDFSDAITGHTVDLLRVSDHMRDQVLQDLERLELELLRDLEDVVGKTDFTVARMRALLAQTQATIGTAYDGINEDLDAGLRQLAQLTMDFTTGAVNRTIGAELLSVALSPQALEAIAGNTVIFGKFPWEWWQKQNADLQDKFARAMRDGQYRGETIDQLTRRVRGTKAMGFTDGILQVPKNQAEALVRTSVLGVSNEARQQTIEANRDVIKGVQWVSTLDSRTTEICQALDGLSWEFPESGDAYADYIPVDHDKAFSPPPAHWNCRSTIVPITYSFEELAARHGNSNAAKKAAEIPEGKRASMDGQVSSKLTFDDWLRTKDEEFQDEVLGAKVAEMWRAGKMDLVQLTDARNTPLTVEQLIEKYGGG